MVGRGECLFLSRIWGGMFDDVILEVFDLLNLGKIWCPLTWKS